MSDHVDIIMATYNGEKYIAEQIDSIFNQTYQKIHLFIRDDQSRDLTVSIIKQKMDQYSNKITLLPTDGNLGIIGNFSALMQQTTARYVMFSDQDDVWLPEKISVTLNKMKSLELQNDVNAPLLVHTDLQVVDANLNTLSPSFWKHFKLNPQKSKTLNRLLAQNTLTGCTIMINRPLVTLSHPIPKDCIMHDYWLGLVAASFGKIDVLSEPTMLYRQHGNNEVGAKKQSFMSDVKKALSQDSDFLDFSLTLFVRQKRQAELFLARYQNLLDENKKRMLSAYCGINEDLFFKTISVVMKFGIYRSTFYGNAKFLMIFPLRQCKRLIQTIRKINE